MQFTASPAQYTTASVAPAQYAVQPQSVPQVLETPQYLGAAGQYAVTPYAGAGAYSQYTAAPQSTVAPQYMSQVAGAPGQFSAGPAATCQHYGNVFMPDANFGAKRETDVFSQMDVNGDGVLSRAEFMAMAGQ